jgi:hypothetical protein
MTGNFADNGDFRGNVGIFYMPQSFNSSPKEDKLTIFSP